MLAMARHMCARPNTSLWKGRRHEAHRSGSVHSDSPCRMRWWRQRHEGRGRRRRKGPIGAHRTHARPRTHTGRYPKPKKLQDAKTAALSAYTAASSAVANVAAMREADPASYSRAQIASEQARAANVVAQAATTSEAARAAQRRADSARSDAVRYSGMVSSAHRQQAADAVAKRGCTVKGKGHRGAGLIHENDGSSISLRNRYHAQEQRGGDRQDHGP